MKLHEKIRNMNLAGFVAKTLDNVDLNAESETGFWTVGIIGENLIYRDEEATKHRTEYLLAMAPGTKEECHDQMIALEFFLKYV